MPVSWTRVLVRAAAAAPPIRALVSLYFATPPVRVSCVTLPFLAMARITFLALAAASVSAFAPNDLAVPAGFVQEINAGKRAWVASDESASRFSGWTRAQVSRILGSRKAPAALKARHDEWDLTELPLSALLQQQGKTSVWLLDKPSMTVKPQPVTVAGADGSESRRVRRRLT